jgi:hypothetical protein
MQNFLRILRKINWIHFFAIAAIIVAYALAAGQQIEKQTKSAQQIYSFSQNSCKIDHAYDSSALRKCYADANEMKLNSIKTDKIGAYAINSIAFMATVPIWFIVFNIFSIVLIGYKDKYDLNQKKLYEKLFHYSGIFYTATIIFALYVYYSNLVIDNKIPVTPLPKSMSVYETADYGSMKVTGVWVPNGDHDFSDISLQRLENQIASVSIECNRNEKTCNHVWAYVTTDDTHALMSDTVKSEIKSWTDKEIVSEYDNGCYSDGYRFDLKSEQATRYQEYKVSDECQGGLAIQTGKEEQFKKSFTLKDGVEVRSALKANELPLILRLIRAMWSQ